MKITLLGTGDAVGTPKIGCDCPTCKDAFNGGKSRRSRYSILIESNNHKILVDSGPDLRCQFLKKGINHIDAVIWTHTHYDHYAGFGDFYRIQENVKVYGVKDTLDYILDYLYFMRPIRHDINFFEPFELIGLNITLIKVTHPPLKECAGLVIYDGNKKLVITGDTSKKIPQKSKELMFEPDLLIADAIIPPIGKLSKHMNSKEAMELAKELNSKSVILTHISHLFPPHNESSKTLPLGFDGMEIVL